MKSPLNFAIVKDGQVIDLHSLNIWVSDFEISSPNPEREYLKIKGVPGAIPHEFSEGMRKVKVTVQIDAESERQHEEMKSVVYDTFYSEKEYEIIRDVMPDRRIFVMQESEYEFEPITWFDGQAEITLTMAKPYLFGTEKTHPFSNGAVTIRNAGTVPAKPIIEALVNEPITYMDVYNDKGYMRIGEPVDAGNTAQQPLEWVLNDPAENTLPWKPATWTPDGGTKAGSLMTTGSVFYTTDYGTGDRWHGPARTRSLSTTATDYKIRVTFIMESINGKSKGRSEIYLLNTLGEVMGKIAVVTNSGRDITIEVNLRNGPKSHYMVVERNFRKGLFNGHIILTKKGINFSVEIGVQSTSSQKITHRYKIVYTDWLNEYQSTLAAVGVHLGAFATYPTAKYNRIRGIFVQKVNAVTGTPYIAETGDIITLDFNNSTIFINDEERKDLKDFGSTFFSIPTGQTTLLLEPESLTGELRYREVFR